MMTARDRRRRPFQGQDGVLLVSLLIMITVMMILLTASAQSWSTITKREREQELIFRGNQYIVALTQYAKEHGGAYPMDVEDLLKNGPMGHRYIRQLFADPFDKEGKWNFLYLAPGGKGAINPNARYPQGGVMSGSQLGGIGPQAAPGGFGNPSQRGLAQGQQMQAIGQRGVVGGGTIGGGREDREGEEERESGFKSGLSGGQMNAPIVGVVSKSKDRGFRMYYGRHYYDEWEFHVFQNVLVDPNRQPGQGSVVNPLGRIGSGNLTPAGTAGMGETQGTLGPGATQEQRQNFQNRQRRNNNNNP